MNRASRAFDDAEAGNVGNPACQPYPKRAHRHLGLIAEAVLAERAAMRAAVSGLRHGRARHRPGVRRRDVDYRADAGRGACRGDRPADRQPTASLAPASPREGTPGD